VTYLIAIDGAGAATGNYLLSWAQAAAGATTFAAVLPYARSVNRGTPATAFATVINAGSATTTGCAPALPAGFPGTFVYQTTDAANALIGAPNTPADIAVSAAQGFVFGITPGQILDEAEVGVVFTCTNTPVTVSVPGVNTFLLSASDPDSPRADLIAIGATISNDGIVNIPGNTGTGFFAAAAIDIGAGGAITATADDGGKNLPVKLTICETDPATGACKAPPAAATVRNFFDGNNIATYTVFVTGTGNIPFDPANNRLFLRLKSFGGITRGATNVAVRTQ
jgi:hypothetical protein